MRPKTGKPVGRPRSTELDRLEKGLDVTRRRAKQLKASGVTMEDLDSLAGVKLKKLRLEGERIEMQLAILRKEHVPRQQVFEHFLKAFTAFRGEIMGLGPVLAPQLVGLNEAKIHVRLYAAHEAALNRLASRQWPDQ